MVVASFVSSGAALAQVTVPNVKAPNPPEQDPFCPVSVVMASASSDTLVGRLRASGDSLSAHIIVFSDTNAYTIDVPALPLSSPGPGSLKSTPQFAVTFSKAIDPRFAYVDTYRLNGSREYTCPTEPVEFDAGAPASVGLSATVAAGAPGYSAASEQPLPSLPCGSARTLATIRMAFSPGGFDRSMSSASTRILVYVGASGQMEKAIVLDSSGSKIDDDATMEAARRSTYAPAQFYCTPVVGTYLFEADFKSSR
jgi:hypothetical protein